MQKQSWKKLLKEVVNQGKKRHYSQGQYRFQPAGNPTRSNEKGCKSDEKTFEAVPSTPLPAGQPNPVTPVLSSLRPSSAPSRPREACELLEEESPMKNSNHQMVQARSSRSIW